MSDEILARLKSIEHSLKQNLNSYKSYLYKLTHRRLIPCFKPLGKKLFFKRQDLEVFLLQGPVKTIRTIV